MFKFDVDQPMVLYTAEDRGCIMRIDLRAPTSVSSGGTEKIYKSISKSSVKAICQSPALGSTQLFLGGKG